MQFGFDYFFTEMIKGWKNSFYLDFEIYYFTLLKKNFFLNFFFFSNLFFLIEREHLLHLIYLKNYV